MAEIKFTTEDTPSVLQAIRRLIDDVTGDTLAPEREVIAEVIADSDIVEKATAGNDEPVASTATPAADGAPGVTDTSKVDPKGVGFNAAFCAKAQDPFYASGKRKDQWKKRKNVSDEAYDEWYAGELANAPEAEEPVDDETVNTSAAFGSQDQEPETEAPKTSGELMAKLSEMQVAGVINQDQIGQAYLTAGIAVTDLFPPNPPEVVEAAIAKVWPILASYA